MWRVGQNMFPKLKLLANLHCHQDKTYKIIKELNKTRNDKAILNAIRIRNWRQYCVNFWIEKIATT
jgi:hypothetical protein